MDFSGILESAHLWYNPSITLREVADLLSVQSSLYVDAAVIVATFVATMIIGRKRSRRYLLWLMLAGYLMIYFYLVFFHRRPTPTAHAMLTPFWSYREAFSMNGIDRLGLAREILMNILVYIPLGLILACMLQDSRHPILYPLLIGLGLSIITEVVQYFGHIGLMETDDVMNNTLGTLIGLLAYKGGHQIVRYLHET